MHGWKRVVLVAALPLAFASGAASAAMPLTNDQMDGVTAGFTSFSNADAQALGKITAALTATVSQVAVVTTTTTAGAVVPVAATFGETTLLLYKSLAGSQSASTASIVLPTVSIGLSSP